MFLKLFFILAAFTKLSESIALNCKFTQNPKYGYTCIIQNHDLITSRDDREITEVIGQHSNGKTGDDVKFFQSLATKINFLPRAVTKFFKNVEVIEIKNANLMEITKDDLEEFGDKLKKLWLGGNEIKSIDANLFEYNRNLEKIGLDSNEIEWIDVKAFNGLKNLQSLYLRWNLCTSEEEFAENDRNKVLELIKDVEEKCKKTQNILVTLL